MRAAHWLANRRREPNTTTLGQSSFRIRVGSCARHQRQSQSQAKDTVQLRALGAHLAGFRPTVPLYFRGAFPQGAVSKSNPTPHWSNPGPRYLVHRTLVWVHGAPPKSGRPQPVFLNPARVCHMWPETNVETHPNIWSKSDTSYSSDALAPENIGRDPDLAETGPCIAELNAHLVEHGPNLVDPGQSW